VRYYNFWCYRRILFTKGFIKTVWQARKNVLADNDGSPPPAGPYLAELDITYRCNCRCRMCQRWNEPRGKELGKDTYRRLAADLYALGTHQISIAGGEPLLRPDVFAIIKEFSRRRMSVNVCTNGILLEQYSDSICDSGATCISVSMDGASADCHDTMRGTPGSFAKIVRGLEAILRRPKASRPIVRVRMTVSDGNVHELDTFYRQWKGVADDVLIQPVHKCATAYYVGENIRSLQLSPEALSGQISGRPLGKSVYLKGLMHHLRRENAYPAHRCFAGILMARIDPWGQVYPCLEQHRCVGSVHRDDFASIWHSPAFNRERIRLNKRKDCRCWFNNTAIIGHYGNALQYTRAKALIPWNHKIRYLNPDP